MNFGSKWLTSFILSILTPLSEFGIFSYINTIGNTLSVFFAFGSNLELIHKANEERDKSDRLLIDSIIISTILFILFLIFIPILSIFLKNQFTTYIHWSMIFGFINAISLSIFSYWKGKGFFYKEALCYSFYLLAILLFGLCLYLFDYPIDLNKLFFIMLIIYCIPVFTGFLGIKILKSIDVLKTFSNLVSIFKSKSPYGIHSIQVTLYTNISYILLGFLVTPDLIGTYKALYLLALPASLIPGIFSQVLLQRLSETKGKHKEFKRIFRTFLFTLSLIGISLFLLYLLLGENIINLLYHDKISSSYHILIYIFLGTITMRFISSNYGILITAMGKQNIRVYVTFFSLTISTVLLFILTKRYSIIGASLANMSGYLLLLVCYFIYGELLLKRESL